MLRVEDTARSEALPRLWGGPEALRSLDWSFERRSVGSPLERLHPYPAKFISEIPAAILDNLPLPEGTVVLDPFMGSGTTLVEAQRRGYPAAGIDVNPIACLIGRVRTSARPAQLISVAEGVVARARAMPTPRIPTIPRLTHWFKPNVQDAVARLKASVAMASPEARNALELALSSILVRVSNQESDTRYAAIEKGVTSTDVFAAFLLASRRIDEGLASRNYALTEARIIEGDTLKVERGELPPVGIVITSPPYPNAYEYWLYHKYRMWWLGHDPLAVKEAEIGARAHFFKKNHHTADHFVQQMHRTFELLRDAVVPGGYVCFVVGRSKIHGRVVDNAAIISQAANLNNFTSLVTVERTIAATKKSFNLSHANIKTEHVLVFQK